MTERERRQILEGFNETQQDYRLARTGPAGLSLQTGNSILAAAPGSVVRANSPEDLCFHQLFEQQVERVPERIALVFGEQRLFVRMKAFPLNANGKADRRALAASVPA